MSETTNARATGRLTIGPRLHGGEREFRAGEYVAYGTAERDGACSLTHAPDDHHLSVVAAAVDALSMRAIGRLVARADRAVRS